LLEPAGEGLQVWGKGGKAAHGLAGEVGADGGPDFAGAAIEAGGVGVNDGYGIERRLFIGKTSCRIDLLGPPPPQDAR